MGDDARGACVLCRTRYKCRDMHAPGDVGDLDFLPDATARLVKQLQQVGLAVDHQLFSALWATHRSVGRRVGRSVA